MFIQLHCSMESHVELVYLATGCNKSPHSADWGVNGIICYSSNCAVILRYDKTPDQQDYLFLTLNGHQSKINSVRWIKRHHKDSPELELISTSTNKTAIVWKRAKNAFEFEVRHKLTDHTDSVTIADGTYFPDGSSEKLLVVTSSVDSHLRIWERKNESSELVSTQIIKFKSNGFALDVKITLLPSTNVPLIAAALDDATILLYVKQDSTFINMQVLTGHEDWVRALDFITTSKDELLLASGSQDSFIRLWKIHSKRPITNEDNTSNQIALKEKEFQIRENDEIRVFGVVLEAVMAGHENWIYGVHWHLQKTEDGKQFLRLLSSSMDKTIIVWASTSPSGLWLEEYRLGELSGNLLGFYGSKFSPCGKHIIAHGFQGSFHFWKHDQEQNKWIPEVPFGGHFNEVHGLAWDPTGSYVLSASTDQTTRLHGPWLKNEDTVAWHEIARPQVHGYDMTCITSVSTHQFVSGADEKILRAFTAPKMFIKNFVSLCGLNSNEDLWDSSSLPEGAAVPALSLSNKAVFEMNEDKSPNSTESAYIPLHMKVPPTEDDLIRSTLWPETKKLYGHGFEVFCVACNHEGTLIASACKASKAEDATIIIWEVKTWKMLEELKAHSLTITQLAFSPDDSMLLSVSRDRTWALFRRCHGENTGQLFEKLANTDKSTSIHSRIIWSCSWTHDSKYFVTASRDKKVIVWGKFNTGGKACTGEYSAASPLVLSQAVTAVDFSCNCNLEERYILAIGLETGSIHLYTWTPVVQESSWKHCLTFDNIAHHASVQQLCFRPCLGFSGECQKSSESSEIELQLASCAKDYAVRVYNVAIGFK